MFFIVLTPQGLSFCNSARLSFQAFAGCIALNGCRIGQKMNYHFSVC